MKTNEIKSLVANSVIENPLCTFIFEGRKCWKGIIVASILGYNTPARAINRFLKARDLVKEVDYDILEGIRLKEFKKQVISQVGDGGLKASKVIIFYRKTPKTTVPCACGCKELNLRLLVIFLLKYMLYSKNMI